MRESNYRSVSNNRAAVTITTSLYDRRALDVTLDKPLVNSLNHLTYLVSSSAKVRETLLNDGGLERLVEILHECHISACHVRENVFNCEKKLLTAWKWTLAFQCLVLIGTRGTENIRQKVVRAGMLPVIATVLDNYINLHEATFFGVAACAPLALAQFCAHAHSHSDTAHPHAHSNHQTHTHAQQAPIAESVNNTPEEYVPRPFSSSANEVDTAHRQNATPTTIRGDQTAETVQNPRRETRHSSERGQGTFIPTSTLGGLTHSSFCDDRAYKRLSSEDYEKLSVDLSLKLLRDSFESTPSADSGFSGSSSLESDIRRKCLTMNILNKLREKRVNEIIYPCNMDESEHDMDSNLQFLSNLYLLDEKSSHVTNAIHSKIAPRNFTETGVIIPRDDDVVWCLQLLAYISKYPYLKEVLQNTHLLIGMSIKDKNLHLQSKENAKLRCRAQNRVSHRQTLISRPRSGRDFSPTSILDQSAVLVQQDDDTMERFNPSASNSPELGNFDLQNDNFDFSSDKLDLCNGVDSRTQSSRGNDMDVVGNYDNESVHKCESDEDVQEYQSHLEAYSPAPVGSTSRLRSVCEAMRKAETITNDIERKLALIRLSNQMNDCIEKECRDLSVEIIEKRLDEKKYLSEVWDYDSYDKFDIDGDGLEAGNDYDVSLMEYKRVNLFPIVEKFTFLAGTDMYYWSGVIMRNSCRRNDFKGGVRQCGNLECGKWEQTPREFSKCKRCKRTKYCSRDCQMRAWHCHKNWCVPSNSSTSTNTTDSGNTALEGQHDRTINMGTTSPVSEGVISNTGELSQHVSASDQDTPFSEL